MFEDYSEKLKRILPKVFHVEEITNFKNMNNKSVNDLFSFNVEENEFIVRILIRQPMVENEYYRFEKEAKLMQLFTQLGKNVSVTKENQVFIPVPKLIHMESNDDLIGYKYLIMEKIDGISLEGVWNDLSFENKKKIVSELAQIIKGIHSIDYEMFGEIEEYDCPRRFYSMKSMLKSNVRKSVLKLGKKELLPIKLLIEIQKFVEKNLEKANFSNEPKLVHNDLNPSNILISNDANFSLKAILDFEWSYAGDPIVDFWELENHIIKEEELRDLFFERYFDGKDFNTQEFSLEKTVHKAISALDTVAFGWVHFHPTEENINHIKRVLEEIITE
ncbi:MAG TPA: aminoglycoside phosphotransferase family protein [Candidatus Bathyarchaeia archaeon]|nr:aminoglycoside phosphotransferase family protein [Candidatus Bathyarchaeia archaeon]